MRWVLGLIVALALIAVGVPTDAKPNTIRYDSNGNPWRIDPETAATLGAGSGEGAVIGEIETRTKFDLQISLTAAGSSGDEDSKSETALTGIKAYYRPSPVWRMGGSMKWDLVDQTRITFGLPISMQIKPNEWRDQIFWLNFDVLPSFTIRTGEGEGDFIRESAWSWVPKAGVSMELPMGEKAAWSTEIGLGAGIPVTLEGVSDEALNSLVGSIVGSANFAINVRFR